MSFYLVLYSKCKIYMVLQNLQNQPLVKWSMINNLEGPWPTAFLDFPCWRRACSLAIFVVDLPMQMIISLHLFCHTSDLIFMDLVAGFTGARREHITPWPCYILCLTFPGYSTKINRKVFTWKTFINFRVEVGNLLC